MAIASQRSTSKLSFMRIHFDRCFDRRKIIQISPYLPAVYAELNRRAPWRRGRWPSRIRCMTHAQILQGREKGAGHGFVFPHKPSDGIFMNPLMSPQGYLLVLIHENCHVGWPDMSEDEINCVMLGSIWKSVTGKKLDPAWARKHGVGAPAPYGDRSYCR